VCGGQFHIDDDFAYAVRCPHCKRCFEVSSVIELREMPESSWEGCEILTGYD
jgi:hypothetical protein